MLSDQTWLLIGVAAVSVIVVSAIGLGLLWGAYLYSRNQRQSRSQFSQGGTQISLGEITPRETLPDYNRIQWGAPESVASATNTDNALKCPICRLELNRLRGDIVECPNCQQAYHQTCWSKYNEICLICQNQAN